MKKQVNTRQTWAGRVDRVTKGLWLAAAVLALLVLHSALTARPADVTTVSPEKGPGAESRKIVTAETKTPDFEEYAAVIRGRDLFAAPDKKHDDVSPAGSPGAWQEDFALFSGGYELRGVVIDGDPVAIIEDIRRNQTLFLSRNEKLGEAVVKEILDQKVVFEFRGQDVEMVP